MASPATMALARTALVRVAARPVSAAQSSSLVASQLRFVSSRSTVSSFTARPVLRQQQAKFRPRQTKRSASTAANPSVSFWKRMWDSPVGLKTVHFWAPVMKWALVIAGIADFARPAEKLSFTQNVALTATGLIWTRWCLIIKPKNYLLAAVNFFLGMVGIVQISRIAVYQTTHKGVKDKAAEAAAEPVAAVKEAIKE